MCSEMEEWCGFASHQQQQGTAMQQPQQLHHHYQQQQQQPQLHQHQHQGDQFLDSGMSYSSPVSACDFHHQHQHQHQADQFLDSSMSYSSPVASLLSPDAGVGVGVGMGPVNVASAGRLGASGSTSRLLSMRQQQQQQQQMNLGPPAPLNVVVPPMSGFSNPANMNILSPGLLPAGAMLDAGSPAVTRMMTDGSIVRELFSSRQGGHGLAHGQVVHHHHAGSPPGSAVPPLQVQVPMPMPLSQQQPQLAPAAAFPMFNSPAAASAALDRVLSRAGSWVNTTPAMPSSMAMAMDSSVPGPAACLPGPSPNGQRLAATSHCLAQFSSDPGFAERAARFSSFSNGSSSCSQLAEPPAPAARQQQSRRAAAGASPIKAAPSSVPGLLDEGLGAAGGSKLWRTSSCPPLGNDASSPTAAAADDVKHLQHQHYPASNCDAATNSSGSNAPACMEADQRSPSACTGVTEFQYQRQQQQAAAAAAAASDKRKGGGSAAAAAAGGGGGKRLARTSSCPSAVAKLALEAAVPKMEQGAEQQGGNAHEDSSSSEQGGDRDEGSSDSQGKKRKSGSQDEKATSKHPDTSPASTTKSAKSGDNEESVVENPKRSRGGDKDGKNDRSCSDSGDSTSPRSVKEPAKPPEVPKPDYIHVRARRGQATDSHSLAERVRREKISERMKFLQDLVPGCSKVTGKAVMLDEIINYVQTLKRQVEFLTVKLESVNPRMDFNMDPIMSNKEMLHYQPRALPHQQQMIIGPDTITMASPFAGHLIHQQQHPPPPPQPQHQLLPMQMAMSSCAMQQMIGPCGLQQQQQHQQQMQLQMQMGGMAHMGSCAPSMMDGLGAAAPLSPSCLDTASLYGDTMSQVSHVPHSFAAAAHTASAAGLGQQGHEWGEWVRVSE